METIHFIAIGGQGMSGIARILLDRGYKVTGSDLKASSLTERLQELGAQVYIGHRAENLGHPDMVVVSSAIHPDNPELDLAKSMGIPVVHRMDALLTAVEGKRSIAIAGAHGKTTTTSMIAWILSTAGLDPTYLVGGEFGTGGNARSGNGDLAVFETDESDGSFLKVRPDIAVVTNIDNDHLEHWGSMEALEHAFASFLGGVRPKGARVVCADDPRLRRYIDGHPGARSYAINGPAVWEGTGFTPQGWGSRSHIVLEGREVAVLNLSVPGAHNAQNAVGALAAACAAGMNPDEAARCLASFAGVKRRMERIGQCGGVLILDDFAHHPKEIAATLSAIKEALPGRPISVVFQPHRFSRTRLLKDELASSLSIADRVIVTGIYGGPGEEQDEGVSPSLVTDSMRSLGHPAALLVEDKDEAAAKAAAQARPGDVIVTLGAGDIWKTHSILKDTLAGDASNR